MKKPKDSLVTKYIENVVNNPSINGIIDDLVCDFYYFDENDKLETSQAIDVEDIGYLILITKISTMIDMFDNLKEDNNVVMADKLSKDIDKFKKIMLDSIYEQLEDEQDEQDN